MQSIDSCYCFRLQKGKTFMFCLLFGIYLTLAHGEGAEILCEEIHENVYTTITAYKWNVNNNVKYQISSNQIYAI